ncbi:SDR family oxidoreductase [Micromonospora sp. NBC_00898]|uniref:SDR family oxidoreductase n=1 Tax=Micromonospora sp. NBC_00898 TaxID=2975981 RepID=UPI003865E5C2
MTIYPLRSGLHAIGGTSPEPTCTAGSRGGIRPAAERQVLKAGSELCSLQLPTYEWPLGTRTLNPFGVLLINSNRANRTPDLGESSAALQRLTALVGVTAIDPGPTDTGWMTAEIKAVVLRSTPLGRLGRPQDCANLVAFLCSPDGGWINGQLLHSNGGIS